MADLTSTKSERVTSVRLLHDRRHRAERGAFVVEGPQGVDAALGGQVTEIFVTSAGAERHAHLVERARAESLRVTTVTDDVIAAMAETRQPQGILAVCSLVNVSLAMAIAALGGQPVGCLVVLDRVNDPGNAGTVIRTADAMGAAAVILTEGSVDPHNGKCVRATAGSLFHVPIVTGVTHADVVAALDAAGILPIAADSRGSVLLGTLGADALLAGRVAWIIGSEAHGIDPALHAAVRETVAVPMFGSAESLNMAAAAAICLYATARAQQAD